LNPATLVALAVALATGIALGIQATTNSWLGTLVGPLSTGLLVIIAGGVLSALVFLLFMNKLTEAGWATIRRAQPGIILAGALAVVAIAGTAYALPRTGIAAGVSAIILGQMVVAVVVDSTGWGAARQIALTPTRIAGLALLALATWLLVPKTV
jgi:transporter family-2 protein